MLARADKTPPPPHLSDLGIASLMETSGRERRHRYYTVASYRQLVVQEGLDPEKAGYAHVDFESVGEFKNIDSSLFYEDEEGSVKYQNAYKTKIANSAVEKKANKNLVLPDRPVNLGKHPTKETGGGAQTPTTGKKRKVDDIWATSVSQLPSKKQKQKEDETESAGVFIFLMKKMKKKKSPLNVL